MPDGDGALQRPEFVLFESLGWKSNPFLESKIRFRLPIIETLAREAGIELGVLDLLKTLGVTSTADLRELLDLNDEPASADGGVYNSLGKLNGDEPAPASPGRDLTGSEPVGAGQGGTGTSFGGAAGTSAGHGTEENDDRRSEAQAGSTEDGGTGKRDPTGASDRVFISYIATQSIVDEADPDGLDQPARMALEAKAIDLITEGEPQLRRTPTANPGFDLFELGAVGEMIRWVEVKAMTGSLQDRPVGMSHTQFEHAQKHGKAYWLYVVEHAGDARAHIVQIRDPAGKARTFTFDYGWLDVAEADT